jgi:hypothetical protein
MLRSTKEKNMSIEVMKQALGALEAHLNASDSQEDARAHTMLSVTAGMLRAAIVEAEKQPEQSQWVGFTDEEVSEYDYMDRDFVRDIEAVLKHKNTRLG